VNKLAGVTEQFSKSQIHAVVRSVTPKTTNSEKYSETLKKLCEAIK
jgi:hypothetical protein